VERASALLERGSVHRIAVVRALFLGDMLVVTPALRALRASFPGAEITLIGLPWADPLVLSFGSVDRFVPFPGYAGIPEVTHDPARTEAFVRPSEHISSISLFSCTATGA
jgi:hypothetical protein